MWEERGSQVFWGHYGLYCREDEKASPTPQGESCILVIIEGLGGGGGGGIKGKDDQESGIQAKVIARLMAERWESQQTKKGLVEMQCRIYKKLCVKR